MVGRGCLKRFWHSNYSSKSFTMETMSLNRQSSRSFEESSWETHIDSDRVSLHWQLPLRTTALLDFAIAFPVSTETTDTNSLSHPLGTWKSQTSSVSKEWVTNWFEHVTIHPFVQKKKKKEKKRSILHQNQLSINQWYF